MDDKDGVANGTPDVELDGGHGSHWKVLLLTQIHHRVVVPVPLPIWWNRVMKYGITIYSMSQSLKLRRSKDSVFCTLKPYAMQRRQYNSHVYITEPTIYGTHKSVLYCHHYG